MKTVKKNDAALSANIVAAALAKDAAPILKRLAKIKIRSNDDLAIVRAELKALNELEQLAKAKMDSILKPITTSLHELFNPFRNNIKAIIEQRKNEMQQYLESSKAKQAQLAESFQNGTGRITKVATLVAANNALEITSGVRKTWKAVEVDASKTPRQYLVPDVAAIRAALADGKAVAGWEYKQVETITL